MDSSGDEEIQATVHSKKRKRVPKEWTNNIAKHRRNSDQGKRPTVACQHPQHSYCKASVLTQGDCEQMFRECYIDSDKVRQDTFITSHIQLAPVKRHRQGNGNEKARSYTADYSISREGDETVRVCQKTFMSVLSIKPKKLFNLQKYMWQYNNPRPERRGGFRAKPGYAELKEEISNHIKPSTLSVHKMYLMFKEKYTGPIDVKYVFYHGIFVSKFNLGFGAPKKDVCSCCTKLKVQIRAATEPQKKQELVTELMVHRFRAKKFYQLLDTKQDESVLTVSFDLMQNVPLPKSPIGEAYYARQLWAYFGGIIEHKATENKDIPGTQNKKDVHFYTWGEHQMGRVAKQIASAICNFIDNRFSNPDHGIKKIIFFSDSCVGQNKNFRVLSTVNLLSTKHGLPMTHIFPLRGHSYMPPDRAFGRVEQKLKKMETVLLPEEYFNVFSEVGKVHVYNVDWFAYDFKEVTMSHLKKQHSFKITEAKMLEVGRRGPVKVYNHYSAAPCEHSILKRGHNWNTIQVQALEDTNCVRPAKKKDVLGLLKAMGYSDTGWYNTAHDACSGNCHVLY